MRTLALRLRLWWLSGVCWRHVQLPEPVWTCESLDYTLGGTAFPVEKIVTCDNKAREYRGQFCMGCFRRRLERRNKRAWEKAFRREMRRGKTMELLAEVRRRMA